jgi:glutamate 5-kinase
MAKGIIVVKVGTSTLSESSGRLDISYIDSLTSQLCQLIKMGYKVILVTSGAVGAGMDVLGLSERPKELVRLQACAAIGQGKLMKLYEESFRQQGMHAAQILLTQEDFSDRKRFLSAKNTLSTLLDDYNAVPVINENDTIATEEIKFGDNDRLSALVASLIGASMLVILTDVDGLYSPDDKKVISLVTHISHEIETMAHPSKGRFGIGGMATKLAAAKIAVCAGITCIIANGRTQDILLKIEKGEGAGTLFLPQKIKTRAKKSWLAFSPRPKGVIMVDDGAKTALVKANKSLLAAGIKNVSGKFSTGDVVSVCGLKGIEFAKGVVNFSSDELDRIKSVKSSDIEKILQRKITRNEVIHRDNLVILI